jgi:hypothetical protein
MKRRNVTVIGWMLCLFLCSYGEIIGQQKWDNHKKASSVQDEKVSFIQQGYSMKLWMSNDGRFGHPDHGASDTIDLEFPTGSGYEHLWGAYSNICARVSDSTNPDSPEEYIAVTRTGSVVHLGSEMTPIDTSFIRLAYGADSGAISDNDLICVYTDTANKPEAWHHRPLGIKVIQRSLAWKNVVSEPILPIEFTIVNIGQKTLRDVIISFYVDGDVGSVHDQKFYFDNGADYNYHLRMLSFYNLRDTEATPVGVTLLNTSRPFDSLLVSPYISAWGFAAPEFHVDSFYYDWSRQILQHGISRLQCVDCEGADMFGNLVFGPFPCIRPGDTIKYTLAFVSGKSMRSIPGSLTDNALKALCMSSRNYHHFRSVSPPLMITRAGNNVKLDWRLTDVNSTDNPLEIWVTDDENLTALPDTHWRRRNPPSGITTGGRNFEGFQAWRLESDTFDVNRFQLLAQYDVNDDLNYGYQTGLQYTLVDSSLRPSSKYWYAVTSYTIPSQYRIFYRRSTGELDSAMFPYPWTESDISENAQRVTMNFLPSNNLSEIKVVPNPYRADRSYTEPNGFEGPGSTWDLLKRTIWFIHLPAKATITIYTMVGEHVATLYHDDAVRTLRGQAPGQEEWNMSTGSSRPLASGVYVYTVDSNIGKMTGKFVIIK